MGFHEISEGNRVVKIERGNAVNRRSLDCARNIGHDGNGVHAGHLAHEVGVDAIFRGRGRSRQRVEIFVRRRLRSAFPVVAKVVVQSLLRALDALAFRREKAFRNLGEIGPKRPAALRAQSKRLGDALVRLVARTHELDGRQAAFTITLHDDDVVARHASHDVGAFRLALERLHAGDLPWRCDDSLRSARLTMTVGVLAWIVDVEALVAVMFHTSHVVSPSNKLFDKLHDEGRFPRIVAPDDRDCRARHVDH